ncbi:uncharacterized protein [Periplaneta americana]|uniref:uncharacterized protein isoform X3 n=1 Tax=Periplaneta americana TaxID=6978 RepID=UPI0037E78488
MSGSHLIIHIYVRFTSYVICGEETRVDGTQKLKSNAVPIIFFFSPPSAMKRKPPIKRTASAPKVTKSSSSPVLDSQVLPQNMEVSVGSGAELQPSSSHAASSCEISTPESSASSEASDDCCETELAIQSWQDVGTAVSAITMDLFGTNFATPRRFPSMYEDT